MDGRDFRRTCICESFEEMCVPLNEVGSKTDVLFSEIASLRAKLEAAETVNSFADSLIRSTAKENSPRVHKAMSEVASYDWERLREAIDAAREG